MSFKIAQHIFLMIDGSTPVWVINCADALVKGHHHNRHAVDAQLKTPKG